MQPRWGLCHGAVIQEDLPLRPGQWVTLALWPEREEAAL